MIFTFHGKNKENLIIKKTEITEEKVIVYLLIFNHSLSNF